MPDTIKPHTKPENALKTAYEPFPERITAGFCDRCESIDFCILTPEECSILELRRVPILEKP